MRWHTRLIPNDHARRIVTKFAWIPVRVRLGDFDDKKVYEWLWLEEYVAHQYACDGHWYLKERTAD